MNFAVFGLSVDFFGLWSPLHIQGGPETDDVKNDVYYNEWGTLDSTDHEWGVTEVRKRLDNIPPFIFKVFFEKMAKRNLFRIELSPRHWYLASSCINVAHYNSDPFN